MHVSTSVNRQLDQHGFLLLELAVLEVQVVPDLGLGLAGELRESIGMYSMYYVYVILEQISVCMYAFIYEIKYRSICVCSTAAYYVYICMYVCMHACTYIKLRF